MLSKTSQAHRTHWDNITVILGLYRGNGKENGNYHSTFRMLRRHGYIVDSGPLSRVQGLGSGFRWVQGFGSPTLPVVIPICSML